MKKEKNNAQAPVAAVQHKELKHHGKTRVDPYYWMRLTDAQKHAEHPDEHTQKVLDYLHSENTYTARQMAATSGLQDTLYSEMAGRVKANDNTVPYFKNGYWYYTRYEAGKEYPIYCRKKETLDTAEEVMLDVSERAKGLAYYHVRGLRVSPDNQWLAYSEDTVSRRIYTTRFKNLETGVTLPDKLMNVEPGGAWANDSKTFFYTTKNNVSLLPEKVWRHRVGTPPKSDEMVYHEKDPSFDIRVYRSKSGQYILIHHESTLVSDYHLLSADTPNGTFTPFTKRSRKHEYFIEHYNDRFYIVTNWEAKNFRVMETPENATTMQHWEEVVPHREQVFVESMEVFKDYLVLHERKNALAQLNIVQRITGESHYLPFDEPVYVLYIGTNPEFDTPVLRFGYSSLTTPVSTIDYHMDTRHSEVQKVEVVNGGHVPEQYVSERLFATARDGEHIPISLVYKKGLNKNGHAPLVLYGYGSYGSTVDPAFSATRLSLLDRGFIWAIAHVRGGQEKGRSWYEKGKMMRKKNTFYDFVDCAAHLQQNQYSSAQHMYAFGGSAGGLLMGSVMNLAPHLFNGVVAAVPFVDVVTTMLDETIPLTTIEYDEWGNPNQKEAFEYMLAYSPYDNVAPRAYPHALVTTGFFDSQVQYWEPAKWVAKLRAAKTNDNLLLLHTDMDAGHGGASGRFQRFKETALIYAFLLMLENRSEE